MSQPVFLYLCMKDRIYGECKCSFNANVHFLASIFHCFNLMSFPACKCSSPHCNTRHTTVTYLLGGLLYSQSGCIVSVSVCVCVFCRLVNNCLLPRREHGKSLFTSYSSSLLWMYKYKCSFKSPAEEYLCFFFGIIYGLGQLSYPLAPCVTQCYTINGYSTNLVFLICLQPSIQRLS